MGSIESGSRPAVLLRLFVTGNSQRSLRAVEAVQSMCSEFLGSGVRLEVVDVLERPVVLISGATGTGKTLTATGFLAVLEEGERGLLFAFEESRDQLYRNALGWGIDFPSWSERTPAHSMRVPGSGGAKKTIEEFRPSRVAVDSLSALERISTPRTFREFVLALTSYLKDKQIAGLFTSTTPSLLGGSTVTEAHISSVTDSIILLRYVEAFGEMRAELPF